MNDADLGWFVRSRGRVLGPFQLAQLEVLKNQGRLAKFDELSRDRRAWVRASSLPELFPPPAPPSEGTASLVVAGSAQPVDANYRVTGGDPATEEATGWFYIGDAGQVGPLTLLEMIGLGRTGVLRAETFVWNSNLTDWIPARDVPALGLTSALTAAATPMAAGVTLALAGFVLGVLGLLCGAMAFLTSAFISGSEQNRTLLMVIFLGLVGAWGISSLLAVILSSIGMVRINRAGGERRGFGLGLAGMVMGIVGTLGLLVLMFSVALGVMASKGAAR